MVEYKSFKQQIRDKVPKTIDQGKSMAIFLIPYSYGSDTNLSHPNQWRKHRDETKCEDCSRHHNANNCDKYLNNRFISKESSTRF